MPTGEGKYDDLCTYVRKQAKADGAAVIIIGGTKGEGFSVQGTIRFVRLMPSLLRNMADQIERENKL